MPAASALVQPGGRVPFSSKLQRADEATRNPIGLAVRTER